MSILSRLFGRGTQKDAAPRAEPERYEGYDIHPEPMREGTQWRIAARIEGEVDGEKRVHHMIRADLVADRDIAVAMALGKAQQMINEQGAKIFERSH